MIKSHCMSESELYISNMTVTNITFASDSSETIYMTASIGIFKDIIFQDSSIYFMVVTSSTINIDGFIARNITGSYNRIITATMVQNHAVTKEDIKVTSCIKNMELSNIINSLSSIITITRSHFEEFSNIIILNCVSNVMDIKSTSIDIISNLSMSNSTGGLIIYNSTVKELSNSNFTN